MSLESWKKEFYPIDADKVPEEDAVSHSLKKWEGALPENLAKHGVNLIHGSKGVCDKEDKLPFHADSCALCQINWITCATCPIAKFKEYHNFPTDAESYPCEDEFTAFGEKSDPIPMIELLRATKQWQDKQ